MEGAASGDGWRRGAGGSRGLPPSVRQCVTVPSCCCSLWVTPAGERGGGQPLHPSNLSPALTRPSLCVLFTAAQGNKKRKETKTPQRGVHRLVCPEREGGASEQVTSEISGFLFALSLEGSRCGALAGRTAGGSEGKGESAMEGSENSCVPDGRRFRLWRGNVSGAKGKEEEELTAPQCRSANRSVQATLMRLNKPSTFYFCWFHFDCCGL